MKKTLHRILILLLVPGLIPALLEPALSPIHMLTLNGWIANFNPGETARALKHHTAHLSELSIFGAGAHTDGRLAPENDFIYQVVHSTRKLNPRARVLLTVTNYRPGKSQDGWLLRHWLGSPEAMRAHIEELLKLTGSVDGLDIDYENVSLDDARRYAVFVEALGKALHQRKKFLTLSVEHQLFESSWLNWTALSAHVDRIRIMAYQYHYERTAPGAVSPPGVVRILARRALREIPADKLEIALPMYGFDWSLGKGKVVGTTMQYQQLAVKPGAHVFRDPATQATRIDYSVTQLTRKKKTIYKHVTRHEVWFEDAVSFAYKVNMLRKLGVKHIGLWQVGAGDLSPLFKQTETR